MAKSAQAIVHQPRLKGRLPGLNVDGKRLYHGSGASHGTQPAVDSSHITPTRGIEKPAKNGARLLFIPLPLRQLCCSDAKEAYVVRPRIAEFELCSLLNSVRSEVCNFKEVVSNSYNSVMGDLPMSRAHECREGLKLSVRMPSLRVDDDYSRMRAQRESKVIEALLYRNDD